MRSFTVGPRRYGRAAAVLLLLLASACSLETKDDGIGVLPNFRNSTDPIPEPDVPPIVSAEVTAAGLVTTNGQLVATCATGTLAARVEQQAENLKLRVIYVAPAGCTPTPTLVDYTIYLSHVPEGTYHFSVVHEGDRQVPSGTAVVQQDITVF
ncbi:MAG TPA: hypothetical protein VF048_02985 [Gemmatimonadaceae bacterium]|jgi:hypothetical protein